MEKDREERLEQALKDCKDVIISYNLNGNEYWSKLSNRTDPDLVRVLYNAGKEHVNDFKNDYGFKIAISCYYEALVMIKREYEKQYDKIIDEISLDVNVIHQAMMP